MKEFNKFLISVKTVMLRQKKNRNAAEKGVNYEKCQQALQKVA